jgi:hypothetical protein
MIKDLGFACLWVWLLTLGHDHDDVPWHFT